MSERINLQQFCFKNETRWYIAKPWRRGPFTYATNGHICVRVDAIDTDEEQSQAPNPEAILSMHPNPLFAPLRAILPDTPRKMCETCGGSGIWLDDPYPGAYITCEACDGEKTIEVAQSVLIGSAYFSSKYIAQISALPGAEFPTNPAPAAGPRDTIPTPFRFAGGIGCIMPMKGEGKVHLGDLDQFRVTP